MARGALTHALTGEFCGANAATPNSNRDPIAPTEFPTGWSVAQVLLQCDMQPAGGGYRSPVTSEDGYRLRLTPECLGLGLTIGQ
jgi:hypothetical protein